MESQLYQCMIASMLTCLLHSCCVKAHLVSYTLLEPFDSFIDTHDLIATLVDSASQLPSSLPPHVTASLPQNIFVPIPAKVDLSNTNVVTVPLGSISDLPLVELGTSLTIILCFFWLVLVSWNTSLRLERRHTKQE